MIKKILIKKYRLKFAQPFKISYEEVKATDVIIVGIFDERGNVGLGSASPDERVTGEKIEKVFLILKKRVKKSFFSFPISSWYRYHQKIQKEFWGFPSAQSALEEAILNLFSIRENFSLTNFFGGYRKNCPISITIGIKPLQETLKEVRKRLEEGYKIIKLKGGKNLKEDLIKIEKIGKILSKREELIVDLNGGYSVEEGAEFLRRIKSKKVKLVEQPIRANDFAGLKKLKKISKVPIVADESASNFEKMIELIVEDYVDGINIKLMKCGGPINFLKIFHLAKSFRKITMIGCMYESHISLTTGAHLALALPVDYVDLDSGRLDFANDPTEGGAIIEGGKIKKILPLKLKNEFLRKI
jgi:L-alanine-DL-glutamate epimerase-like enolase superfamily enzyme